MIIRILTCSLALATIGSAQESNPNKPKYYDEDYVQRIIRHYGFTERAKQYRSAGQAEIASLTQVFQWLEARFGRRSTKAPANAPLRLIDEPLEVVVEEDDHRKVINGVWVHVLLMDTFEGAGRAAAVYLSQRSVLFETGSFSGMPVGDWAARLDFGDPTLVFIRKNTFVRVSCQRAVEVVKSDKSVRGVADPGVKDMCEALARDIDAQIERLPSRKM